jgi:hypothetical protein
MEVTMIRKLRARLSYANVASTLALVLAVGGGSAYAAQTIGRSNIRTHAVSGSKIAKNAVTASKVRNSALSGRDLRDGSVTTADVANGSLQAVDFAAGQLPKGDKGDKGDPGAPATALHGAVPATGVLASPRGITVAPQGAIADAVYTATFSQDVNTCTVVATLAGADPGSVTAQPNGDATPAAKRQVTFRTFNGAGVATPRAFGFAVFC